MVMSSVDVQVPFVIVQRKVADEPAVTPVTVVVAEDAVVIVAVPDTTLHAPVPVTGVFAAIVKVDVLHCVISEPAADVVGAASLVMVISSVDVQVPFVIVQRNVADVPAVTPVTVVVTEDDVVIVAVPDTTLHDPVPVTGVLAAIVNVEVAH